MAMYSKLARKLNAGDCPIVRGYKSGSLYKVSGILHGAGSLDGKRLVVYTTETSGHIRHLEEFADMVEHKGRQVPRFEIVDE